MHASSPCQSKEALNKLGVILSKPIATTNYIIQGLGRLNNPCNHVLLKEAGFSGKSSTRGHNTATFLPYELPSRGLSLLICAMGLGALNSQSHPEAEFTRNYKMLSVLTPTPASCCSCCWARSRFNKVPSSKKSLPKLYSCHLQLFHYITACLLTENSGAGFSASDISAAPAALSGYKILLAGK